MSRPRKHHYCPKSYLAFFTNEKAEDGTLWAIDKKTGVARKSSPINEAHERDFYFVEVERDKDPYFLEKQFGTIESGAKRAIDHVTATHKLPDNEDFSDLANFVALQATRVPHRIERIQAFEESVVRLTAKIVAANPKAFESTMKKLPPAQKAQMSKLGPEYYKKFILEDRYNIEFDRAHILTGALKMASTIVECLARRRWTILVAGDETSFVTSDNPVGLNWIKPIRGPYSPGFGLSNTWVTLPLSDNVALMSTFEEYPEKIEMTDEQVATINNFSIQHASRYVYSSEPDFHWYSQEAGIASKDALAEMLKKT